MFNLKKLFCRKRKTPLCGQWNRRWEAVMKVHGGSETLCIKSNGRFKFILVEFCENEKFKSTECGNYIYSQENGTLILTYDGGALSGHSKGDKETYTDVEISGNILELKDECNSLWKYIRQK